MNGSKEFKNVKKAWRELVDDPTCRLGFLFMSLVFILGVLIGRLF